VRHNHRAVGRVLELRSFDVGDGAHQPALNVGQIVGPLAQILVLEREEFRALRVETVARGGERSLAFGPNALGDIRADFFVLQDFEMAFEDAGEIVAAVGANLFGQRFQPGGGARKTVLERLELGGLRRWVDHFALTVSTGGAWTKIRPTPTPGDAATPAVRIIAVSPSAPTRIRPDHRRRRLRPAARRGWRSGRPASNRLSSGSADSQRYRASRA
jgi:hypothetical protein